MRLRTEQSSVGQCNLLAALILCFHFINAVIGIDGISIVVIGFVCAVALFYLVCRKIRISPSVILIFLFVLFAFLISYFRLNSTYYTQHYFLHFLSFGVISMVIGTQKSDTRSVVKWVIWIGAAGLPVCIARGFSAMDSGGTMGLSYTIFPIFCCALIALFLYRRLLIPALFDVVLSIYVFVSIAPRGIWLSLVFLLFCLAIYRITNAPNQSNRSIRKIISLIISTILIVLVIQNLPTLVSWLNDFFFNTFGVTVSALEKFLMYYDRNNLLNGRDYLWDAGKAYISNNFMIGYGIGYFEAAQGGSYSHNILIQSLCEFGLFFFIPILVVLFFSAKFLLFTGRDIDLEKYSYVALIITCGIFVLFFSSVYWMWIPFWYALGLLLRVIKDDSQRILQWSQMRKNRS